MKECKGDMKKKMLLTIIAKNGQRVRHIRKWGEKTMEAEDMEDWKLIKKMVVVMEDFHWRRQELSWVGGMENQISTLTREKEEKAKGTQGTKAVRIEGYRRLRKHCETTRLKLQ